MLANKTKRTKNPLLTLLLLFVILNFADASIGFSDWTNTTPGNHVMNNYNGISIILKNNLIVEDLQQWYFFRGYIIGEFNIKSNNPNKYFVINESNEELITFENINDFNLYLETNRLVPKIWKRYYNNNWVFIGNAFLWVIFSPFLVSYFIFIIFFNIHSKIKQRNHNVTKLLNWITLRCSLIVGLIYTLEKLPQSF